jgi:hypothetical protein
LGPTHVVGGRHEDDSHWRRGQNRGGVHRGGLLEQTTSARTGTKHRLGGGLNRCAARGSRGATSRSRRCDARAAPACTGGGGRDLGSSGKWPGRMSRSGRALSASSCPSGVDEMSWWQRPTTPCDIGRRNSGNRVRVGGRPWRGHRSDRVCSCVTCPSGGGGVPQRQRPTGGDVLPSGARVRQQNECGKGPLNSRTRQATSGAEVMRWGPAWCSASPAAFARHARPTGEQGAAGF